VSAFSWTDGLGGVFAPVLGAPDFVAWTAPGCAGRTAPFDVAVAATATGLPPSPGAAAPATVFPFPVTVTCP
jgi:hypothetical protein